MVYELLRNTCSQHTIYLFTHYELFLEPPTRGS